METKINCRMTNPSIPIKNGDKIELRIILIRYSVDNNLSNSSIIYFHGDMGEDINKCSEMCTVMFTYIQLSIQVQMLVGL